MLVRRQGQDDVRSTMRFPVVALPTGTVQTDSSAAYPPVPSWLTLALVGAAVFLLLCTVVIVLLTRRTRPLVPDKRGNRRTVPFAKSMGMEDP